MATRISNDFVSKIMDGNAKLLVDEAQRFGKELADDRLAKGQIRGAFGTVRQIQASWVAKPDAATAQKQLRKLLLLKPRLAYQKAREPKVGPLADVLIDAIDLVAKADNADAQTQRFGYLVNLFEAILAYHTAGGGR